ncbi:GNAT family N-acetyltransferase [Vibrio sp. 10N.261.55.A7]|uniref:GNAT family N-acetyltransferase n=1 Tax=Vibrio sp. 10N.261.55.A7 TaxID=1880851 RepID=UPI000CC7FF4F|nr:GNAT family N-acetyltransferase [Vibrio sp. 10N.261.55.A7]PMK03591.1 GNAT family N-acetyltransferase [Vibrio sp. 10N.261.55.A7]
MISFQPTVDLLASAEITFHNMRSYYEHYSVDWAVSNIHEQISGLENWDILYKGTVIGAFRLSIDSECCYLRDLQVSESHQNMGIGAATLSQIERIANNEGCKQLRLRVFKISPAQMLYKRNGFVIDKEEDRFYYMSRALTESE